MDRDSSEAGELKETAPFLQYEAVENSSIKSPKRHKAIHTLHISVLYTCIALLGMVCLLLYRRPQRDPSQGIYSPAQDVIRYKTVVFQENFFTKGPYMGREEDGMPTDETDRLWEDLFQFGINQIDKSEADQLPNKTMSIPTRPDKYVIELDVFHQLHCLNALRKTLYPERYKSIAGSFDDYFLSDGSRNYTSTDAKHFDHCIDSLRQSLMCHGDIATVYWTWMPVRRIPLPRLEITHTCRDFDAIREWGIRHELKEDILHWRPGPEESFQ